MKKFFKVTVLLTLLLLRFPAAAEEKPTVILNLEEKPSPVFLIPQNTSNKNTPAN